MQMEGRDTVMGWGCVQKDRRAYSVSLCQGV